MGQVRQVLQRQQSRPLVEPVGPFPVPAQRALCEDVMRLLGFDFEAGRLDVSTHPFCGGVPEDVRMTTRYVEDQFLPALMGTVHETGHGRYEQNLPRDWLAEADIAPLLMSYVQLTGDTAALDEVVPYINGPWNFMESVPAPLRQAVLPARAEVLLRLAAQGKQRVFLASTSEVYGKALTFPLTESATTWPTTV